MKVVQINAGYGFSSVGRTVLEMHEFFLSQEIEAYKFYSVKETFGKVAAEALSCGTPAVVNNATANPEIPGPCGEIVDTHDFNSVVEAVTRIRTNGKSFYSERCVQRAHELFDKDKNIMQYVELFKELTQKN